MWRLFRVLDEAERHPTGNDAGLHRENMGFHRQIATMSSNEVFAHVLNSLIDLYSFEQGSDYQGCSTTAPGIMLTIARS